MEGKTRDLPLLKEKITRLYALMRERVGTLNLMPSIIEAVESLRHRRRNYGESFASPTDSITIPLEMIECPFDL